MEILDQRIVITRKDHRCYGCARAFPKGTKMQAITSLDGGLFAKEYWCATCQEYWQKHMEYGDLIGYGELKSEDSEVEEIRKKVEESTQDMNAG